MATDYRCDGCDKRLAGSDIMQVTGLNAVPRCTMSGIGDAPNEIVSRELCSVCFKKTLDFVDNLPKTFSPNVS